MWPYFFLQKVLNRNNSARPSFCFKSSLVCLFWKFCGMRACFLSFQSKAANVDNMKFSTSAFCKKLQDMQKKPYVWWTDQIIPPLPLQGNPLFWCLCDEIPTPKNFVHNSKTPEIIPPNTRCFFEGCFLSWDNKNPVFLTKDIGLHRIKHMGFHSPQNQPTNQPHFSCPTSKS